MKFSWIINLQYCMHMYENVCVCMHVCEYIRNLANNAGI